MAETDVVNRRLADVVEELAPTGAKFFDTLAERTHDKVGITRASYGEGEQVAADLLAGLGRDLGFAVATDHAANVFVRRPGTNPDGAGVFSGSHLDSVPSGGNFDGAAGAIAALLALSALDRAGVTTRHDITALGLRGEESAWFSIHHIGARAALGLLPAEEIDQARRFDTQRTLAEYMAETGCDLDALRAQRPSIPPHIAKAFVELHIEQGPVLVHEAMPLGIVKGIRGNMRIRRAVCLGEYAHSGAVPRKLRRDALMAAAELVHAAEAEWEAIEAEGGDLVLTFGKFHTDMILHSHNKVPGEVRFVVDARSHEVETLDRIQRVIESMAAAIAERRGVNIDLGEVSRVRPALMDRDIRRLMREGADALGLGTLDISSGGGHDAGDFANCGIPAGMIFVRNPNGSHNPAEAMSMEDFTQGTKLLAYTLARLAG
jgi:beta-ureidopropionase / N-carbamoyl-L-amino-acid hydrolase